MGIVTERQPGSDCSKLSHDDHVTVTLQQTPMHKPKQSINCPQITTSGLVFNYKSRHDRAMPNAQNITLNWTQSLITACGTSSTNKTLSIQVHGPHMTISQIFGTWIPCFSLSVTTLIDLISQPTRYWRKEFLTVVLRACAYDTSKQAQHTYRSFPLHI